MFFSESREKVFFLGSLFYSCNPILGNYLDKICTHSNNWTFLLQCCPRGWKYRKKLSPCFTLCQRPNDFYKLLEFVKHLCLNTQKQLSIHVCLTGLSDNFCSKDIIRFIYSCHHLHLSGDVLFQTIDLTTWYIQFWNWFRKESETKRT